LGAAAPVRLRLATAAPCLPSAVLVFAGRCAIVFLLDAARCAFFTLALAACDCLVVAILVGFPSLARSDVPGSPLPTPWPGPLTPGDHRSLPADRQRRPVGRHRGRGQRG
jgi:hypothetical protein